MTAEGIENLMMEIHAIGDFFSCYFCASVECHVFPNPWRSEIRFVSFRWMADGFRTAIHFLRARTVGIEVSVLSAPTTMATHLELLDRFQCFLLVVFAGVQTEVQLGEFFCSIELAVRELYVDLSRSQEFASLCCIARYSALSSSKVEYVTKRKSDLVFLTRWYRLNFAMKSLKKTHFLG